MCRRQSRPREIEAILDALHEGRSEPCTDTCASCRRRTYADVSGRTAPPFNHQSQIRARSTASFENAIFKNLRKPAEGYGKLQKAAETSNGARVVSRPAPKCQTSNLESRIGCSSWSPIHTYKSQLKPIRA